MLNRPSTVVEVTSIYPGGVTSKDRFVWSRTREEVLATYRGLYVEEGEVRWEGDTLIRRRCHHGMDRRECVEVLSITKFI